MLLDSDVSLTEEAKIASLRLANECVTHGESLNSGLKNYFNSPVRIRSGIICLRGTELRHWRTSLYAQVNGVASNCGIFEPLEAMMVETGLESAPGKLEAPMFSSFVESPEEGINEAASPQGSGSEHSRSVDFSRLLLHSELNATKPT
ncbi:unnamed protein product [Protopolystoma xenopodis]|uniref:Uncharacterized protein n=1 Tax=Protopolystoma xenopodis TaxID=117903 RepID=A0A3S5FG31_9PLAT|nr:unnamed protein product [Protopolystoma xenopodis]